MEFARRDRAEAEEVVFFASYLYKVMKFFLSYVNRKLHSFGKIIKIWL